MSSEANFFDIYNHRILDLAANGSDNFLQIVPHKVQADPSISTE